MFNISFGAIDYIKEHVNGIEVEIAFYQSGNNVTKIKLKHDNSIFAYDVACLMIRQSNNGYLRYIIKNAIIVKQNKSLFISTTSYNLYDSRNLEYFFKKNNMKSVKFNYSFFKKKKLIGLDLNEVIKSNENEKIYQEWKILNFLKKESR